MNISISICALSKLQALGKTTCCIEIKKGGCFGYYANIRFDNMQGTSYIISGITIFLDDKYALNTTYTLNYISTLAKSGFEILTNTPGCCCNKSFGKPSINPADNDPEQNACIAKI